MHLKLNLMVIAGMLVALAVASMATGTSAGPLDPPAGPASTNAYTLDQVWNRLSAGTAGTLGAFTEPSSGPGTGTMHTLDEIMAAAPAVDANGASAPEVVSGKKFWGLTTGGWGVRTGTAPSGSNVSGGNGSLSFAIPDGFYAGKTATARDTDLTAGNIKQGVNIFGVAGAAVQASGNAVAGDVLLNKTFSNASGPATGSMPNIGAVTLTPGTTDQGIPAGYHSGAGKVFGDAALTAGNIRQGASIFGVIGAYRGWTCTGTLTPEKRWCDNGNGTIRDMTTGLIWLKMANWGGQSGQRPFWASMSSIPNAADFAALLYAGAANANLSDGSVAGDWRLPTLTELKTLTSGTEPVSSVNPRGFTGIGSAYWSSTAENNFSTVLAWYVNPASPPVVALYNKTITMGVWPVRDGQ
jgi:hypothetical protein